ncbi:MAG: hypothetical protein IPL62_06230 [Caulobacteraceae bacterium]|nr:hypothetical protein [Caulobacteraceae bacterium]MBK8543188.1 hypothetical protein [Caulobacteraceae bacterium]MBP6689529.1 hypothetical protein [Hyphomonadaceae bacterium]
MGEIFPDLDLLAHFSQLCDRLGASNEGCNASLSVGVQRMKSKFAKG